MNKKIITNYHGSAFSDTHAGSSWKYVGFRALEDAKKAGKRQRVAELVLAVPPLYALTKAHEWFGLGYEHTYRIFNDLVLDKIPVETVQKYLADYAALLKTRAKLDGRILRPLIAAHRDGAQCAILSTGCKYTIRKTIDNALMDSELFDEIVANDVVMNGMDGSRFRLSIYTPEQRRDALRAILPERGTKLFYICNDHDEDTAAGEVRNAGGSVIVAPLAGDSFRNFASKEFRAHTPLTEGEMSGILRFA